MPKPEQRATRTIPGELEIDINRGVIYFHTNAGYTVLRMQNVPGEMTNPGTMLDVRFDPKNRSLATWNVWQSVHRSEKENGL